jgi:hypothetical protein
MLLENNLNESGISLKVFQSLVRQAPANCRKCYEIWSSHASEITILRYNAAEFPRWVWRNLHLRDCIPIAEELEYVMRVGLALSLLNFQYCKMVLRRVLQKCIR